jgi:hypothetical protein
VDTPIKQYPQFDSKSPVRFDSSRETGEDSFRNMRKCNGPEMVDGKVGETKRIVELERITFE